MSERLSYNLSLPDAVCSDCGLLLWSAERRAEHLASGHCPRAALARGGSYLEDVLYLVGDHLVQNRVSGLNADGTPQMWKGSAIHSEHCPCDTEAA